MICIAKPLFRNTLTCVDSEFQTKISGQTLFVFINLPRLDASASAALKKRLNFDIDPAVGRAEVDLSAVQFIDSSGVGVLLSIYRKLPQADSEVVLRNVQAGVQAVIELLRLHRIFKVE